MTDVVWAFDPGATTGWALWDYEKGECLDEGQVRFDEMPRFLIDHETMLDRTVAIVIEDFRLMAGKAKAQIGSRFETVQVIGMLRLWAEAARVPIKLQAPSIKPIAQRLTGRVPTGAHSKSHSVDAYNHGAYWLRQHGHYVTLLERESRQQ